MADKHVELAEDEIIAARLSNELQRLITQLPANAQVLDWGCGRGRTVLHLRDAGINAWGVDMDTRVLAQANTALAGRGLDQEGVLRPLDQIAHFSAGRFHLIFSEETLEHVIDIERLAVESFRLTAPGGYGLHSFPGSRQWHEPHLKIPFVHWLSSKRLRHAAVLAALFLRAGPRPIWPEACDQTGRPLPLSCQAGVYASYLNEKLAYRPIEEMAAVFRNAGFEVGYRCLSPLNIVRRWSPRTWRDNGFPRGNNLLFLHKPAPHPFSTIT